MGTSPPTKVLVVSKTKAPAWPDGTPAPLRVSRKAVHDARREHEASLAEVLSLLRGRGLEFLTTDRPAAEPLDGVGLMITVGGDGTFLRAARVAGEVPILGVNSAPGSSVGHYCACDAGGAGGWIEGIISGAHLSQRLPRIAARVNGVDLPVCALNDVLFCHRSPATSSRYVLEVAGETEPQVSSGLWVATASGSSAAIRSAGGALMPPADDRLQFLVREPCQRAEGRPHVVRGFTDGTITIHTRGPGHELFFDGDEESAPIPHGAEVVIGTRGAPVAVYGYRAAAT